MLQTLSRITDKRVLADGLVVLKLLNSRIARSALAGQFVNVLPPTEGSDPILRRPFSIYGTSGDEFELIIQVVGKGTGILANSAIGDTVDVLGPLGKPWSMEPATVETAILVIGGVGVASMPMLTRLLRSNDLPVYSYYGARTKGLIARDGLDGLQIATDDGSEGFHGTNIALLDSHLGESRYQNPKLFVCGPTGMMRAAKALGQKHRVPVELSLETEMACGIGICQGCPVVADDATFASTGKRFRLVCTEGPSFMADSIKL